MQAPPTTQPRHHHPTQWTTAKAPVSPYSTPYTPPHPHPPLHTHTHPATSLHYSVNTYQVIINIIQLCQQHPPPPPPPPSTHTHTIHCANQHPASTTHIWLTPIPNHPVTQPSLTSKSIYNHPTHCKPSLSEHIPSHHHYHPILSTPITAPTLHPHCPLHTRSTDLTNTQPAPHTHTLTHPHSPTIQWPNHLPPLSKYSHPTHCTPSPSETYQVIINIIQFCQQSPPPPPPPHHHHHHHTHTIHWPNQHPASTTHTLWLNPIPNHPVTQPPLTIKSKYSRPTHCTPSPSENIPSHHPNHPTLSTIPWFNHIVNNLVSTTPSQHHPHPANTLIPPHSPTGLDISGNYSLPTFFWNFTFFNIEYIDDLVQNCSLSIANALEILHSCTKPSIFDLEDNVAQIHLPGWQFYLPWVSEWLNLMAFLGTANSEVHIVHISHVIIVYIDYMDLTVCCPQKGR